ncbi:MAG: hypothetical protein Q9159_006461 [Coniocarpon cinnabarinum]
MDPNEGIIDAEADIHQRLDHNPPTTQQGIDSHRAEHAALIARGGIHGHRSEEDEFSPLLSKRSDGAAAEAGPPQHTSREQTDEEWPGQKDFEGLPWWKRPHIFWIIGPFILYTIAFGGTLVPKTNLIQDLLCRDYYMELASNNPGSSYTPIMFGQDDNRCTAPAVERRTAGFMASGSLISGILSAITSPMIGELSDYYGRRKILVGVVSGSLVMEILTVYGALNMQTFNVYWLYLGWVFEGLAGSFIAGMALSNAYAADTTPPSRRNVAFGYFHGCLFAGIALGPLIASEMIRLTHTIATVFVIALVNHGIFILCLIFLIPESLSKRRQLAAREKRANQKMNGFIMHQGNIPTKLIYSGASIFRPLKTLWPEGPGTSPKLRANLVVLAAIDFTVFGVAMGAMNVVTIYMRKQFHWTVARQGDFISTVNTSRVLMLVIGLPLLTRIFRGPSSKQKKTEARGCDRLDLNLIRIAVALDTLGYFGYTFARTPALFTLSGIVASLGGMASPTLQSALTKHVPHDQTGQLLGATALLHAIGRILSPLIFNGIFAATNDKFRQTVFACLAAAFGVALVLTFFLRKGIYLDEADAAEAMEPHREGAPEVQRP